MLSRPYSIEFILSKSDFLQSFGAGHTWKSYQSIILLALTFVSFAIMIETHFLDTLFHNDSSGLSLVIYRIIYGSLLTILLAYYVILPLAVRLLQHYQLWRHPEMLGKRTVTITDTQLVYGTPKEIMRIDWNTFTERFENKLVFFLSYVDGAHGKSFGFSIPKRAFQDTEQLADFISLLDKWAPICTGKK